MALQNSGQITLNDIHIEAGGSTGTQAGLNDSDIRSLIGKSSGAQASFSEYYGASSNPYLVGSGSRVESSFTGFGSTNPINLTGAGVQAGDFVVIALTSDSTINMFNRWYGMAGLKRVDGTDATVNPASNTAFTTPGWEAVSGVWQSTDTNPYVTGLVYSGAPITLCFAVFRNVAGRQQHEWSRNAANGYPAPPALNSVAGNTSIFVCTAHLDDENVTMTAPSGYTLAVAAGGENGSNRSSTAIAYRVTTDNSGEGIGPFGTGGATDSWAASSIRA